MRRTDFFAKTAAALLLPALLATGCSYGQFSAVTTGSSLGGLFGSSIGGLIGGPRGADAGAVIGMLAGGAAGAAATASHDKKTSSQAAYSGSADDVEYGTYDTPAYRSRMRQASRWDYVEVAEVKFLDANNDRRLDAGESAFIVMDIYNRGDATLYNVTPLISCDSRRVLVSPPAIVSEIPSGRGVRYKAEVRAQRRLRQGPLVFKVSFGTGKHAVTAKTFSVQAGR